MSTSASLEGLAFVAIGKNEGARLKRCLGGLREQGVWGVYVDSGSSDGSPDFARSLGLEVVELDDSVPFTAARARNAGAERLASVRPGVEYVQFVDGDCEVESGWLERGRLELVREPSVGAVCGRLRERHPEASVYNRLCDLEWSHPPGDVDACGGNAMLRLEPFRRIGGFNPAILAGEEAEMYRRLRALDYKVRRLDVPMAIHEADITRFDQWWRRTLRSGHAYAEVSALLANESPRLFQREIRSNWFYGAALPCALALTSGAPLVWSALALAYPALFLRICRRKVAEGHDVKVAALYAAFTVAGKIPSALGQATFHVTRKLNRRYDYTKPKAS